MNVVFGHSQEGDITKAASIFELSFVLFLDVFFVVEPCIKLFITVPASPVVKLTAVLVMQLQLFNSFKDDATVDTRSIRSNFNFLQA